MANTYTLIEAKTLTSSAASVTFSAIPSTYTDLLIKISSRSNRSDADNDWISTTINGSTSNFDGRFLYANGTSAASYTNTSASTPRLMTMGNGNTATSNVFGNSEVYLPNYAGSNYKSWSSDNVSENNATANAMILDSGLWSDTAAITSILLAPGVGSLFLQHSTFYLYGIKNS